MLILVRLFVLAVVGTDTVTATETGSGPVFGINAGFETNCSATVTDASTDNSVDNVTDTDSDGKADIDSNAGTDA